MLNLKGKSAIKTITKTTRTQAICLLLIKYDEHIVRCAHAGTHVRTHTYTHTRIS